ncbi:pyridoxal-phosphate dependent enzyme [Larkinella terrae]|uniref:pyridoxal-phosphate dependent enzyme n=1 Tax=Larkinella terrae TaxID=2025311 RepID=UPI0014797A7F|nr:pyridoxal-phosphate dependent enzyme [Larkinella terrae]
MNTIWKYPHQLPEVAPQHRVLLGEGQTPLVSSRSIGASLGIDKLYFKLENLNPSGSYKDRFAAVLVSEMTARGQKLCIATSSGNTGAALSAYCAAAGITCILVVVDGAPMPKIRQMQLYGAHIFMVRGFGKDPAITTAVFDALENLCRSLDIPLPISAYRYCPSAMQGVQTISSEILETLAGQVDHLFSPAGGGGLTLAITKGILAEKAATRLTKVNCVQPEGNDTIASSRRMNVKAKAVSASTTAVSGLQVPGVLDGDQVIETGRKTGGNGYIVTDERVFAWQKALAQQEGIFSEPAGAVALAGLEEAVRRNEVAPHETVVCLVTGSGFKDMASVERNFGLPPVETVDVGQTLALIKPFL